MFQNDLGSESEQANTLYALNPEGPTERDSKNRYSCKVVLLQVAESRYYNHSSFTHL